jgi:hypothetical protein
LKIISGGLEVMFEGRAGDRCRSDGEISFEKHLYTKRSNGAWHDREKAISQGKGESKTSDNTTDESRLLEDVNTVKDKDIESRLQSYLSV